MLAFVVLVLTASYFSVVAAISPPSRAVVVFGVDGLSAREAKASPAFQQIAARCNVTYRAVTVPETYSSAAWPNLWQGSWEAWSPTNPVTLPTLFGYIRQVTAQSLKLWYLGSYITSVRAAGADKYADSYVTRVTMEGNVNVYEEQVRANGGHLPDLALLYTVQLDSAGHEHDWGSEGYRIVREEVGVQILRLIDAHPELHFYVVSDHGGRGGGHGLSNRRDLSSPLSDVSTPLHRHVPFFVKTDRNETSPFCITIFNEELPAMLAKDLNFTPHPSWRTKSGPQMYNCSLEDVSPITAEDIIRITGGAPSTTTTSTVVFTVVVALLFL